MTFNEYIATCPNASKEDIWNAAQEHYPYVICDKQLNQATEKALSDYDFKGDTKKFIELTHGCVLDDIWDGFDRSIEHLVYEWSEGK